MESVAFNRTVMETNMTSEGMDMGHMGNMKISF